MATVGELRTQLLGKGYQTTTSTPEQQTLAPLITIHTHPLITNPVVLIGADVTSAMQYQEQQVSSAIQRR